MPGPEDNKPPSPGQRFAGYLRRDARHDAVAGLTVAVMGVPQAMAYAMIAGLPPVYGLYTSIVPCIVAAATGCSNHLVTGPTNAVCLVILGITATIPQRYGVSQFEAVLLLTLLAGLIQFGGGLLKFGRAVKYVSNSVIVGFTAGAGILIGVNQLKNLLEVKLPGTHGPHFFSTLWETVQMAPGTNLYALFIGVLTIVLLVAGRRFVPRLPGSLIALVAVTLLAHAFGWLDGQPGGPHIKIVRDIQAITSSLDIFRVPQLLLSPDWALTRELAAGALALAILGLVESASISRSIAGNTGQRLDFNREIASQGLAKIAGAFCTCFASSGSFTRSAVCYQSGGRTRAAAAISGLATALVVVLFRPLANYIPQSALAGILMVVAFTMVDRERMAMTWRSGRNSRIVMGGTFAATLLLPLEWAVFAGVILSILILLRITGKPDLTQLVQHPDYGFEEVPFNHAAPAPVAIINLEGDLYFAAAEDLDYELLQALRPETRVVVLRVKRLRAVGSSAMAMLEHFHELLTERGIQLILCGVEPEMKRVLSGSGLLRLIGERNIFYADNRIFQSTELAIARSMAIVEMQQARSRASAEEAQQKTLAETSAAGLMQKRCLRFGSAHQVREAMWLVSQFQKKVRTDLPQTVFLQDLDGKLCAELTPGMILRRLAACVPEDSAASLDDTALARALEPALYEQILPIARRDPLLLDPSASLAAAFARAARHSFRPMPVCDEHGRLKGVFDEIAMLRGLTMLLEVKHAHVAGPPSATQPGGVA